MRHGNYRFNKTISLAIALGLAIGLVTALLLPAVVLGGGSDGLATQTGIQVAVRPVEPVAVGDVPRVYLVQSMARWNSNSRYGWVYTPGYYRDPKPYNYVPYGDVPYSRYTPYDYVPRDHVPKSYSLFGKRQYGREISKYHNPSESYSTSPPSQENQSNESELGTMGSNDSDAHVE